jgi:biopolymer transport protein ExbB
VDPSGVTGGVAQALIATAFGIFIAIFSLFGYNYFSRRQVHVLEEMERLGTRIVDNIRVDQQGEARP